MSPEQIHQVAEALKQVPVDSAPWKALMDFLVDEKAEANEFATHPDTGDSRNYWAGFERGLKDLKRNLEDLRSGAYLRWPEMKNWAASRTDSPE